MNNDLISREALKEHKFLTPQVKVIGGRHSGKLKEQITQAYQKGWNDCIDAIIDNAPTVEPKKEIVPVCKVTFDKEQLQEIVDKKVAEMIERLQGEWVFMRGVTCGGYYKCNKCGEVERAEKNYCPNCGALMMKGGKEE